MKANLRCLYNFNFNFCFCFIQMAEKLYVQAGSTREAVDMYNNAGKWDMAHKLAATYMKSDDVSTLYISQARQLEDDMKFKDAEK